MNSKKTDLSDEKSSAVAQLMLAMMIFWCGTFFFIYAGRIESWEDDIIKPSFIPQIVTFLIIILGLVYLIREFIVVVRLRAGIRDIKIPRTLLVVVLPFSLLSFLYALLFHLFGYFISTFLITMVALFIFKNRIFSKIIVISLSATVLFYFFFIVVIGVYDPSGVLISFTPSSILK